MLRNAKVLRYAISSLDQSPIKSIFFLTYGTKVKSANKWKRPKEIEPVIDPKHFKYGEAVSGSVVHGDLAEVYNQPYELDVAELTRNGYLRLQKPFNPPTDVESRLMSIIESVHPNLKGANQSDVSKFKIVDKTLKFELLNQAYEMFKHSVPKSMLHMMETIGDVIQFYKTPVERSTPYEDLAARKDLPGNLYVQKDRVRDDPVSTQKPSPLEGSQAKPLTKKRNIKRKQGASSVDELVNEQGQTVWYPVVAYATCEEINLTKLRIGLIKEGLYIPTVWQQDSELDDVIHVTAKYVIGNEPREMFFFGEGAVVFWNVPESERSTVLRSMKKFELQSFNESEVLQESEFIHYSHSHHQRATYLSNGKLLLNRECSDLVLEKYTIANAMAQSVKLGIWESTLERFVTSIDHITEELKLGKNVKLTRAQVLQKTGELFALRNEINLNSDLLDIPDFYWEHENLETLYRKMHNYLSITRRTEVMNEKLTQCYELLELISGHLNDKHHVRLEWMIIALITVEVVFEILHVIDRYL